MRTKKFKKNKIVDKTKESERARQKMVNKCKVQLKMIKKEKKASCEASKKRSARKSHVGEFDPGFSAILKDKGLKVDTKK
jgi:hypothetical protein